MDPELCITSHMSKRSASIIHEWCALIVWFIYQRSICIQYIAWLWIWTNETSFETYKIYL